MHGFESGGKPFHKTLEIVALRINKVPNLEYLLTVQVSMSYFALLLSRPSYAMHRPVT